jgi:hypothetical protein
VVDPDPFTTIFGINETKDLHIRFISGNDGIFYQDLTISDSCGHSKTIVLKAVVSSPKVNAGYDQTICEHDSVMIGNPATGGFPPYTYNWTPSDGLSNPNSVPTLASPSSSIDYILTVIESNGCTVIDTVHISVNPLPALIINGPVTVCENHSYTYNIPSNDNTSALISIDGADSTSFPDKQDIIITWSGAGKGHIKLIKTNNMTGCSDSVNLEITINPMPNPDIVGDTSVCSNTLTNYITTQPAMTNQWLVTGGRVIGNASASSVDVLWSNVVNAQIKLIQSNGSGCMDSIEKNITVKPSPIIDLVDRIEFCQDSTITLDPVISSGAQPWTETKWTPSTGLSNPNIPNPTLTLTSPGTYEYYLSVIGSNGCVGTDSVIVTVNERPNLLLSRELIDFGTLEPCQSTKVDSLEITNSGTNDVVINNIDANSGFSIDSPATPFRLLPGEKKMIFVRYTSTSIGQVTADINIIGSSCNFTKSFQCKVINPEMLVSTNPTAVNFGQSISCISIATDTTITLTNTGTSDITFFFDQAVLTAPFSLISPTSSKVVTPGNNEQVKIHYEPKVSGNFSEILTIPFDAGFCKDTLRIPLSAINENSVMSSNLKDIDFQDISGCDVSRDTIITIQNTGTNDLTIIGLEPDSVFTTSQINTTVPAGQSKDLLITFSAEVIGSYTGRLIVKYEPCGRIDTFSITGNKQGVAFGVPDSLDFGQLISCRDVSITIQFTIDNLSSPGVDGYIQELTTTGSPFTTTILAGDSILNRQMKRYQATFEPDVALPDGDYNGIINITFLPCNIKQKIGLHAIKESLRDNFTHEVDFGEVIIGTSKIDSIILLNEGTAFEIMDSIVGIAPPFELINTIPGLPAFLNPNEQLIAYIRYTPSDTLTDTLVVYEERNLPCNQRNYAILSGKGISYSDVIKKCSVYIDTLEAKTGETVSMPLMLKSSENLIQPGQARVFFARIRFNATLLAPNETPDNDVITNGERTIEVSGSISTPGGVMKMMSYTTALGNSKCTDLIIDTVIWKNINVETTRDNGRFCLTNVCPEGGDRLLNPDGSTQILSVHPNPTSGDITIEFKLSESGFTEFLIINYLGETVKKVAIGEIKDYNTQSLTLNLDDLSTGQYFLILRTPTEAVRQIVMIVR